MRTKARAAALPRAAGARRGAAAPGAGRRDGVAAAAPGGEVRPAPRGAFPGRSGRSEWSGRSEQPDRSDERDFSDFQIPRFPNSADLPLVGTAPRVAAAAPPISGRRLPRPAPQPLLSKFPQHCQPQRRPSPSAHRPAAPSPAGEMYLKHLKSVVPVRSVASVAPVGLFGAVQPRALGVLVRPVAPVQPVRPVQPAEAVEAVQLNWQFFCEIRNRDLLALVAGRHKPPTAMERLRLDLSIAHVE
eukprot:gene16322-biopygen10592